MGVVRGIDLGNYLITYMDAYVPRLLVGPVIVPVLTPVKIYNVVIRHKPDRKQDCICDAVERRPYCYIQSPSVRGCYFPACCANCLGW